MAKSKPKKFPVFHSASALVDYFDEHDLGDYLAQLPEAAFDVKLRRRLHLFAIDPDVADRLNLLARAKRTSAEKLLNTWAKEKVRKESSPIKQHA